MGQPHDITIYLSGPMSGMAEHNHPAFHSAAARLRALGFVVFNPAETFGGDTSLSRRAYMSIDLAAVPTCDWIVKMPEHWRSEGAMAELMAARNFGLEEMGLDEAIEYGQRAVKGNQGKEVVT